MALSAQEIEKQSLTAMQQSGEKWKKHAARNGKIYQKVGTTHKELFFDGWGKCLIVVGMGPNLNDELENIKKYKDKPEVDIACVDKAFSILVDNGIIPKYVFLADANIDFDKWCKPYLEKTKDVTLIAGITSNPEFAENWQGNIFFYVNKDAIKSEEIFCKISGCNEIIPASSNVGNAILVFAFQILGYKEYLLVGYDYSWKPNADYYSLNDSDKRHWMRQHQGIDGDNNIIYTSENLLFSAKWLGDFYNQTMKKAGVDMYNCSNARVADIPNHDLVKRIEKFNLIPMNDEIRAQKRTVLSKKINIKSAFELNDVQKDNDVLNIEVTCIPKKISLISTGV